MENSQTEIVIDQFWERKGDKRRIRIMAVKDKYAMCRIKGCYPFVVSFNGLRSNYVPIPVQVKSSTRNHTAPVLIIDEVNGLPVTIFDEITPPPS